MNIIKSELKIINITDGKEKLVFNEEVSIITLDKFSDYIKKAGLKIIDVFGNYHLESFNALKSERLILVCKK